MASGEVSFPPVIEKRSGTHHDCSLIRAQHYFRVETVQ